MEQLADVGITVSVITAGEIYDGLLSTASPAERQTQFDRFLQAVDVVAPDLTVAQRYAAIRHDLRARGLQIPDNDIWIAATALAHGLSVVSRDVHFDRIPDLEVYRAQD
jgi:tRNA(fMet)-specific endonuclease VapC